MTTSDPTTGKIVRALRYCADVNSVCGDACPAHLDEAGCRTVLMQNAADRLESQEQKMERLTKQNKELVETVLRKIGVSYSKNVEGSVTFCGLTMDEAVDRIMQFPSLTARAEQDERERDAAVADIESLLIQDDCQVDVCWACNRECGNDGECKPKWRGLPQEGE